MSFRPDRYLLPTVAALALAASVSLPGADLLKDKPTGLSDIATTVWTPTDTTLLRDVRLEVGLAPGIENVDVATSAWSGNATTDAQPALALTPSFTVGGIWSSGFGLGVAIATPWRNSAGTASNGDRFTVRAYGLEIAPLVALRVDPRFHLELAVPLAAGFAEHEMPGFSSDRADWWSTGLRLGGIWTYASGLQWGVELGWLAMSTMGRVTSNGGGLDVTYHSRGLTAGLILGYRL